MSFKIGFNLKDTDEEKDETLCGVTEAATLPSKCVAEVYFPDRKRSYSYYNCDFDLKVGDLVYVDGKLEGLRGRVTDLNYNFKIDLSFYKRVIAVVDTNVNGEVFMADSHVVTFDRNALNPQKLSTWYLPPEKEQREVVSGFDDSYFYIENLREMNISKENAEEGSKIYKENGVLSICVDEGIGHALVDDDGSIYEVNFSFEDGKVSRLVCPCFEVGYCAHEFAVILQLRETFDLIAQNYAQKYDETKFFASVLRYKFIDFVLNGKPNGSIIIK